MGDVYNEAEDQYQFKTDDPRKLKSFLGGDNASRKTLRNRSSLLKKRKEAHKRCNLDGSNW